MKIRAARLPELRHQAIQSIRHPRCLIVTPGVLYSFGAWFKSGCSPNLPSTDGMEFATGRLQHQRAAGPAVAQLFFPALPC